MLRSLIAINLIFSSVALASNVVFSPVETTLSTPKTLVACTDSQPYGYRVFAPVAEMHSDSGWFNLSLNYKFFSCSKLSNGTTRLVSVAAPAKAYGTVERVRVNSKGQLTATGQWAMAELNETGSGQYQLNLRRATLKRFMNYTEQRAYNRGEAVTVTLQVGAGTTNGDNIADAGFLVNVTFQRY